MDSMCIRISAQPRAGLELEQEESRLSLTLLTNTTCALSCTPRSQGNYEQKEVAPVSLRVCVAVWFSLS